MKLDALQVISLAAAVRRGHPEVDQVTVLVPSNRWSPEVAAQVSPAIVFVGSRDDDDAGDSLKAYVYPTGSWEPGKAAPFDLVALGMDTNGDGTIDVGVIRQEWHR